MQGLHAAYACLARVVVVLSLALGALTAAPAHASSATADPVSQDAAPRAARRERREHRARTIDQGVLSPLAQKKGFVTTLLQLVNVWHCKPSCGRW
jgi:hypothetical protein